MKIVSHRKRTAEKLDIEKVIDFKKLTWILLYHVEIDAYSKPELVHHKTFGEYWTFRWTLYVHSLPFFQHCFGVNLMYLELLLVRMLFLSENWLEPQSSVPLMLALGANSWDLGKLVVGEIYKVVTVHALMLYITMTSLQTANFSLNCDLTAACYL